MIMTLIVLGMLALAKGLIFIFPDLPDTPQALIDAKTWIVDLIESGIDILNLVYTPTLLIAMVAVMIAIFSFENIYHASMWVLKKIPMINIK